MHLAPVRAALRAGLVCVALLCAAAVAACGTGLFQPDYEYEEEIYLALDGSATFNVNASVAALVALRGFDLDPDPGAAIDPEQIRRLFGAPERDVTVDLTRRGGRRFVHVSVDVADVRELSQLPPRSWASYELERRGDVFEFRQALGRPAAGHVPGISWSGDEQINVKLHLPSEILFHNSDSGVERGNILEWQQPLEARLAGEPLALEVHLEPDTILYTTLILFGSTLAAVAVTFAVIIWWIARRGRDADVAESRP